MQQAVGIPLQRDAARFQHIGAAGHAQGHLGILLHQQDRHALFVQAPNDVKDLLHHDRSQTHGGFVQQQHICARHHGAAHGQHLLLTARKRACDLPAALFQAGKMLIHQLQIGDNGACGLGVSAHFQIFLHGHAQKNAAALRHVRQPLANDLVRGHGFDAFVLKYNVAGFGAQQSRNGFQVRAFACAVGTDEGNDLALVHRKADVVQGVDVAVIHIDAVHLQHSFTHGFTPPACPDRLRSPADCCEFHRVCPWQ